MQALGATVVTADQAEQMLDDVNMLDKRNMHSASMSRGDKRRLEMAMCLVQNPKLLLLDEPTAGMARADTNNTIDLLKRIKEERDITIAIIEHDMHVVFSLAERITVLAQGTPLVEDTPESVQRRLKLVIERAGMQRLRVDEILSTLTDMAKIHNLPVLAISELARDSYKTGQSPYCLDHQWRWKCPVHRPGSFPADKQWRHRSLSGQRQKSSSHFAGRYPSSASELHEQFLGWHH